MLGTTVLFSFLTHCYLTLCFYFSSPRFYDPPQSREADSRPGDPALGFSQSADQLINQDSQTVRPEALAPSAAEGSAVQWCCHLTVLWWAAAAAQSVDTELDMLNQPVLCSLEIKTLLCLHLPIVIPPPRSPYETTFQFLRSRFLFGWIWIIGHTNKEQSCLILKKHDPWEIKRKQFPCSK